jgi:hypothetical protein
VARVLDKTAVDRGLGVRRWVALDRPAIRC